MKLEDAVRTRRTHKAYRPEPVDRQTLDELFELARWAPNHHLTNPWRFRVIGPSALARLKEIEERAKPGTSAKLDRAPTLVAVTARQTGDPQQDREDLLAGGVALYIVLLAAHARGLAGYWRTVSVLDDPEGKEALGIAGDETAIGLLHLGWPRQEQRVPERAPVSDFVDYLD
jgi:nitroreductase